MDNNINVNNSNDNIVNNNKQDAINMVQDLKSENEFKKKILSSNLVNLDDLMSDPNAKAKANAKNVQYNFDLTGPTLNMSGYNQQQNSNNNLAGQIYKNNQ